MEVVGVIPARYDSSRMPGKPIVDICGKPMIWWVYNQVKKVQSLEQVCVATDDLRIQEVCDFYDIPVVMTSKNHPDHIARVQEVSDKIAADYYLCINGDEPLIDPVSIQKIIPSNRCEEFYFGGAMRVLTSPAQTIDSANLKVVVNQENRCLYLSRTPVPYPKGALTFNYNKYVGIECFNKVALDFFVHTPMGVVEKIEDIDHLRFIEHNKPLLFSYVESDSISVDTIKDLYYVKTIIEQRIKDGDISNE
ncbi:MAG: 3-deoxy-manno-octulosonate cytidylyltransferase [Oscillospiraceae bacterium]